MTKGTTTVLVVGGVLVIAVGGVFAYISARKSALAQTPYRGPAPPPPPQTLAGDIRTIGSTVFAEGGRALSQLGHNEVVTSITGGEKAQSYVVKNVLTGGLYSVAAGGKSLVSKLLG